MMSTDVKSSGGMIGFGVPWFDLKSRYGMGLTGLQRSRGVGLVWLSMRWD